MKTNLLNLFLISIICLLLGNVLSAQKPDIKKIYSELPDEFFSLRIFEDSNPLFHSPTRNEFLREEFFDSKEGMYIASFWDYGDYYGYEEIDTNLVVEPNYWIKINQEYGLASYKFEYEGNTHNLDMIIVEKESKSYLVILERYNPGMGVPAIVETNVFPIINSEVINEKHPISIPQLKWTSFYSKEIVKKINTKLLKGVNIPYLIDVEIVGGESNLCLSPNIVELTWRMSEIIEFENDDELMEYERYLEAEKILGFKDLEKSKPVYIQLKDLIK
ncbi:MAG: hypothetical protein PHW83_09015 [Bacteroidales bacterium]|nr:hypothetical protein [Bacteroidales bacterium]